jgi:hypothetical protein
MDLRRVNAGAGPVTGPLDPLGNPTASFPVTRRRARPLRRRTTHHRPFDEMAAPERSVRASPRYLQTMRGRVRSPDRRVLPPPRKC